MTSKTKAQLLAEIQELQQQISRLEAEHAVNLGGSKKRTLPELNHSSPAEELVRQFGEILNKSLNEIYIFDTRHLKFIHANDGALKNLGYSLTELKQFTPLDIKPEFNKKIFKKLITPLLNGEEEVIEFTTTHQRKDGSLYPVEVHLQLSDFGKRQVFLAVIVDITKNILTDKKLRLLLNLTQGIIKTQDFNCAVEFILRSVCEATSWAYGEAWIPGGDSAALECLPVWHSSIPAQMKTFRQVSENTSFPPNIGLPGRVWSSGRYEWIADVSTTSDKIFLRAEAAKQAGLKAALGVPLFSGSEFAGVLVFFDVKTNTEDKYEVELVTAVAAQLGEILLRKRAESAQSQANNIINRSPVVAFLWRNEEGWPVDFVSENVEILFGYSAQEFLERKISYCEIIHCDDLERVAAEVASHSKKDALRSFTHAPYRIITKNGEIKWIEDITYIRRDSRRIITHYEGIVYDITERKLAEERIIRDTKHLKLLLELYENIPNLTATELYNFVLDQVVSLTESVIGFLHFVEDDQKTIRLTTWNKEALKTCSVVYDTDYLIEQAGNWVDCVRQKRPVVYNKFSESPNQKGLPEGHTPIQRFMSIPVLEKDKVRIIFGVGNKPYDYDDVDVIQVLLVANELHKIIIQKRNAEELHQLNIELEQRIAERTAQLAIAKEHAESADRLKSAFLATMSHELRTPLNSIIGFTGILLQNLVGPLNEEQNKQLKMVQGSAHHLLDLINDVLDISKIEAGQLEIVSRPFNMREIIQTAVETITPLANKQGLELKTSIAPQVGQITSDRRRVEQILLNLLNNAVKFTKHGEVRLDCAIDKEWLLTRVSDTGVGIQPKDLDLLFKPFQQVNSGIARDYEGTGLGLSICKRLVEMLGGTIWVESEWGAGSAFTFSLPLERTLP